MRFSLAIGLVLALLLAGCADSAYNKARRIDSIESWQVFLDKHPEHPQANEAAERLGYLQAEQQGDEAAWTRFLERFPDGRHAVRARINQDKAAFNQASNTPDAAALQGYLQHYPQGAYRDQARALIWGLGWDQAQASGTFEGYERFIAENPGSPKVKDAELALLRLQAEQEWGFAAEADTVSEWDRFITKYAELPDLKAQAEQRRSQAAGGFYQGVWFVHVQGLTPAIVLIDRELMAREVDAHAARYCGPNPTKLPSERELNQRGIAFRRDHEGRIKLEQNDNVRGELQGESYVVSLRRSTTRSKSGWVSVPLGPATVWRSQATNEQGQQFEAICFRALSWGETGIK